MMIGALASSPGETFAPAMWIFVEVEAGTVMTVSTPEEVVPVTSFLKKGSHVDEVPHSVASLVSDADPFLVV